MEKPDANGFVTIKWPSKTIPHGGVFHTRTVNDNPTSQEYLKVLLNESKLAVAQREKSKWENRLRMDEEPPSRPHCERRAPLVRPRTSKRRSLSAIRESGIYEHDGYRPMKRGEDREKLKEKLQHTMAYGDSDEIEPRPLRLPKTKPVLPSDKEKRHNLLTQIRERAEWLAEMEVLGEAAPHREIMRDQIAERIRALDALGIDSECSTARSTGSGFSTLRSREPTPKIPSANRSGRTNSSAASQAKKPSARMSSRTQKEENVSVYNDLPKLRYSPRRRC